MMRSLLLAMLVLLTIDAVLFVIFVRYFFKEIKEDQQATCKGGLS
jgi:competence protein ComGC